MCWVRSVLVKAAMRRESGWPLTRTQVIHAFIWFKGLSWFPCFSLWESLVFASTHSWSNQEQQSLHWTQNKRVLRVHQIFLAVFIQQVQLFLLCTMRSLVWVQCDPPLPPASRFRTAFAALTFEHRSCAVQSLRTGGIPSAVLSYCPQSLCVPVRSCVVAGLYCSVFSRGGAGVSKLIAAFIGWDCSWESGPTLPLTLL